MHSTVPGISAVLHTVPSAGKECKESVRRYSNICTVHLQCLAFVLYCTLHSACAVSHSAQCEDIAADRIELEDIAADRQTG